MTREEKYDELPEAYKCLVDAWRFPVVMHRDVVDFSGGAIKPGTLNNICSKGLGPGKFKIMNKVAYNSVDLAYWLHGHTVKHYGY